jgi:hypothetical protein
MASDEGTPMKEHLDHRIRLGTESEYKSLYAWFLEEVGADGNRVGSPVIPWPWTLNFMVGDLSVSTRVERGRLDDGVGVKEVVHGKLVPVTWRRMKGPARPVRYSMLGTARPVENLLLYIEPTATEDAEEACSLWGAVSYTSEVDFVDETEPDTIQVTLSVRPSRFLKLLVQVRAGDVESCTLALSGVAGIYSEWSPSIRTDAVKVLTGHASHAVEGEEASGLRVPRLGSTEHFIFSFNRVVSVRETLEWQLQRATKVADGSVSDEPAPAPAPNITSSDLRSTSDMQRVERQLRGVRIALWVIAILLVALWFTG